MLPRKLILENYMGHKYSEIDCTLFNSCLIVGVNKNDPLTSNGVGKSTIFFGVDFVLFGEHPAPKIEDIIRDGADFTQVTFEFELNQDIYQVIRRRSKSSTNLYLNQLIGDTWESKTSKTNTQTELELHKLIKISYKAFKNSILFAQKDLEGIPSANSDKRKELLKEPLQILIYNKYHKIANKNLEKQIKELDKIKILIENLGDPKEELKNILLEIEKTSYLIKEKKSYRIDLQNELDKKRQELSDLERMINSDAVSVNNQLLEIKTSIKNIEKNIYKNKLDFENYIKQLEKFKLELADKLKNIKIKEDNLNNLKLENLREPEIIQHELDSFLEKEQRGRILIAKIQGNEQNLLKPIPEVGECAVCFQEITSEHREKCIQNTSTELAKLREELQNNKNIMLKCIAKRQNLEKEQKETLRKISQINSFEIDIANSKNNITKSQELIVQYEKNIENKQNDITNSQKSLDLLKSREITLIDSAKNLNINELNIKISNVKNNINELEININKLLQEISSNDTLLGILEEKKKTKENNILSLEQYLIEKSLTEKKVSLHQKVVKAFSSNGIPTLIINTILDDLQTEGNLLLSQLRPSIQFQFKLDKDNEDKLDIIYTIHGKERDYKLISGGQKIFIALSFKLGLSRVIQRRLGVDIRFLELDEVDQSLDDAGLEAFAEVIRKWQNDFKIFIITHNKSLKNKFDHAILVEGDDAEGSTAKVVSNW